MLPICTNGLLEVSSDCFSVSFALFVIPWNELEPLEIIMAESNEKAISLDEFRLMNVTVVKNVYANEALIPSAAKISVHYHPAHMCLKHRWLPLLQNPA